MGVDHHFGNRLFTKRNAARLNKDSSLHFWHLSSFSVAARVLMLQSVCGWKKSTKYDDQSECVAQARMLKQSRRRSLLERVVLVLHRGPCGPSVLTLRNARGLFCVDYASN
jgi:hypothetical protein